MTRPTPEGKPEWTKSRYGSSEYIEMGFLGIEVYYVEVKYQVKVGGVTSRKGFDTINAAKAYALKYAIEQLEKTIKELKRYE
jgi:hypothetical protein